MAQGAVKRGWNEHKALSLGQYLEKRRNTGYAKPGLMTQEVSTTEDEHSWQIRLFLPGISSYLPVMFVRGHIQFAVVEKPPWGIALV